MFQMLLWLFCLLFTFPSAGVSGERSLADYLIDNASGYRYNHEIEWIFNQLDKRGNLTPAETLDYLTRAHRAAHLRCSEGFEITGSDDTGVGSFDGHRVCILRESLELYLLLTVPDSRLACNYQLAIHLIRTANMMFNSVDTFIQMMTSDSSTGQINHSNMLKFLKNFVPKHYQRCLRKVELEHLSQFNTMSTINEAYLDRIMCTVGLIDAEQLESAPDGDRRLLEVAGRLSLRGDKGGTNARKLLALLPEAKWFEPNEYLEMVYKTVEKHCQALFQYQFNLLANYNWAKALIPNEVIRLNLPSRFHKINEYFRLCEESRIRFKLMNV